MSALLMLALMAGQATTDDYGHKAVPERVKTQQPDASEGGGHDDDEGVQPATAIVVTAHKLDAARTRIDAELGATAYSLNNETIEDRPGGETGSIGAILGQTPGVGLSSSGLTIRGSSAVQVRINNVVVPEAITDPADRLSSRFAATTKVITGTLPAQFGFAPGGIVSVTTKNGLYEHGGQLEMFAGNHGMVEPALEWSGSTGSTSLFGSGSYETGTSNVAGPQGLSTQDRRHEIGGLAFFDHVINGKNRVSAIIGGSSQRNRFGPTSLGRGESSDDSGYLVGTWQHSTNALTVQTSLFLGEALSKSSLAHSQRNLSSTFGAQIDSSYRIGDANMLRAGLFVTQDVNRFSNSAVTLEQRQRSTVAVYLQDQLQLGSHLTFNAGGRVDWLRGIAANATFEPRTSIVWRGPQGFSLHAGYARYAAVAPIDGGPDGANLPQETDDYFGAGAQEKLGPVTLGVDGYWRRVNNLILEHATPGAVEQKSFAFQRGQFKGIEFSATYASGPVDAWANISLSRARGQSLLAAPGLFPAATVTASTQGWIALASDRPVSGSGGLTWHLDHLSLSADMLAGSGAVITYSPDAPNRARAPAYASFGLSAVYHMHLFGLAADIRADVTDLTNVHYFTDYAANLEGGWTHRAVGRAFMIGIEQAL